MTDQRLAGLSHQELWNLAHGGDPAAASTSQANLSKAAQVLENISHTLNAPLHELGQGWRGRAADAAHGGIGQHAQWAEVAAGRASTAAGQAGQQAASARTVIAEMPPPPAGPPAAGANWAQAEQAQANARQRALELMQGHATECSQTRPTSTFNRPPTAGTTGGAASGTAGTRAGAQDSVRRAPSTNPAAAERGTPGAAGGAGRTVARADLEQAPRAGAGTVPRDQVAARTATRPAATEPYRPGQPRTGAPGVGAALPGEAAPARVTGFRPVPGGQGWPGVRGGVVAARTERVAPVPRTLVERPGPGGTPDAPAARTQGAEQGRSGLRARGEAEGRPGGRAGGDGTGPGGRGQPGADAALLPPVLGATGYPDQERDQHQRLDYLLDETDVFADNDWVAPPVIGS